MGDLILGSGVLAVALFLLGRAIGRSPSPRPAKVLALATVVALGGFVAFLSDNILLARLLPFSNLIIVGNAIPPLLSLLAGIAWSLIPRQEVGVDPQDGRLSRRPFAVQVRRVSVVFLLASLGGFSVARSVWGTTPPCRDRWEGDFCLQTSDSTCTAACAATLLKQHGIDATEREMADLCLTRSRGTLWQGLYRGLKRKTEQSPWDVMIVRGSFDDLKAIGDGPAILMAGIPRDARVARIYTERYGWSPGFWHSVLFFGFRSGGLVAMGDPTPGIGRESWSEDDLRVLWGGRGMRLVPRPGGSSR